MSWINKILPSGVRSDEGEKRSNVPEGLWKKMRQVRRGPVPAGRGAQ